MIKLMEREEIVKFWDTINSAIMGLLPEDAVYDEASVYAKCVDGIIQVWMLLGTDNDPLKGLMTTSVIKDFSSDNKKLLILSLSLFSKVGKEKWVTILYQLQRYARHKGCSYIEAETMEDDIVRLCSLLGGKCKEFTRITFGVQDESYN